VFVVDEDDHALSGAGASCIRGRVDRITARWRRRIIRPREELRWPG
jgi:hypothetical protein